MNRIPRAIIVFVLVISGVTLVGNRLFAQKVDINGGGGYSSLASTGNDLPFWFTHNQHGKYTLQGNTYQLMEASLNGTKHFKNSYFLDVGFHAVSGYSKKITSHFNQLYAAGGNKWVAVKFGYFSDEEELGGLSSSNGSIIRTINSRPYPKIRFETNGYLPVWFWENHFFIKAEYDEGVLNGERIIELPHLHHKLLAFQFKGNSSFQLSAGLNHYVFWGGNSPVFGHLPDKFSDYLLYVTGKSGDSEFLETDQVNVAGNQLGDYFLEVKKVFGKGEVELYISHPFEDHSGMELDNYKDNLYGIGYFSNNKDALINGIVAEILYTKHQSGYAHIVTGPKELRVRGRDNYFNHGIYSSGFTYMEMAMCSPLFYPVTTEESGKVTGFENTRIIAYHLGISGSLSPDLSWKSFITFTNNFGTYSMPYSPPKKQVYSLAGIYYTSKNRKNEFSLEISSDKGQLTPNKSGLKFSYSFCFPAGK